MTKRTIQIYEVEDGWMMRGVKYGTAAGALRAVKRADRLSAARDGSAMTVVEWYPSTAIGGQVTAALVGWATPKRKDLQV